MNFYKIRSDACDFMIYILSMAMFIMSFASIILDAEIDDANMKFASYSITLIFLILEREHSEKRYKETRRNSE